MIESKIREAVRREYQLFWNYTRIQFIPHSLLRQERSIHQVEKQIGTEHQASWQRSFIIIPILCLNELLRVFVLNGWRNFRFNKSDRHRVGWLFIAVSPSSHRYLNSSCVSKILSLHPLTIPTTKIANFRLVALCPVWVRNERTAALRSPTAVVGYLNDL